MPLTQMFLRFLSRTLALWQGSPQPPLPFPTSLLLSSDPMTDTLVDVTTAATNHFGTTTQMAIGYIRLGNSPPPTYVWDDLKMGGGGFSRGLDVNSDGTLINTVDVYGAYIGSTTPGTVWKQLVTSASMPTAFITSANSRYPWLGGGVYSLRIAPSNSSILYMVYLSFPGLPNGASVFVSTNKGVSWVQTSNSTLKSIDADPNTGFGSFGQSMAVDPINSAVCYMGSQNNGIWVTLNTGSTWTLISSASIPNPTADTGFFGIAFDPVFGSTGGKTNRILVGSWNNGVYETRNQGGSWALAAAGGPTTVTRGKFGIDGTYYCVDGSLNLWRLTLAGVWKNILNPATTVACDPANKDNLVTSTNGGYLNFSANATITTPTWAGYDFSNNGNGQTAPNAAAHFVTAADCPWIQSSQDYSLSEGETWFDPSVANRLWMSYGDGVLYTNGFQNPPTGGQQQWISQTAGIESLVINYISWPPGGRSPVVVCWDRPFWKIDNPATYPPSYAPVNNVGANPQAVNFGASADWAITNPDFIVGITEAYSTGVGTSTDGGRSFTACAGTIPGTGGNKAGGGNVVVFDTTHFVCTRSDNFGLFITSNAGATWAQPASAPSTGWGSNANNASQQLLTKDTGTGVTGTAYAYNGGAASGVYKTTDKGVTWSRVFTGTIDPSDNFYLNQIKAVPGRAGELFFTIGQTEDLGAPAPLGHAFYRSVNAAAAWTAVPNVQDVVCFGFSAPAPSGGGYPAIGIIGWVNSIYGAWRSDDNCVTWVQIGNDFLPRPSISGTGGWLDEVTCMEGDPVTWNQWVVGYRGSGCAFYGTGTW